MRPLLLLILSLPIAAHAADAPPARVIITPVVEREVSPTTRLEGVLRFLRVSEVAGEVEGLITAHHFDTGWKLNKGEVLVALNRDLAEQDRAVTEAEIAEVEADIERRSRELKRLQSLKADKVASASAVDDAFYAHKALLKRKVALERRLDRQDLLLAKTEVRAPFDGIVLEKKKELGDWLEYGAAVARFGATEGMQAVIPISESLLPFQTKGTTYAVHLPALGHAVEGTLTGIVPFAEVRSKSVYLKIRLPFEEGMIENISAEVELPTAARRALRLIPRAALLQKPGQSTVFTVVDGKAKSLNVNIVARIDDYIAVDDANVTAGTPVVVDGNDRLQDGAAVEIVQP
ncbi:MAG: efflux RND transporter periplasmic adaptor subunit [Gammaproteobacteria bacterium]|nr:efflux RND transporter periplasmic adaptor subunit [Gammaproteobacteria bacterium]MCP5136346.1 efflux RND transporter periplasmic adaptor subunit [Gammaproteobacteria bacterium]